MTRIEALARLGRLSRRALAWTLSLALVTLGTTGCTTVDTKGVRNGALDPATSAINVRVFDRASDVKAGHPSSGRVASDLSMKSGEAVHHAEGAEWSLEGLQPGAYRLTIRQWTKGSAREEPDARASESFTLRPGDRLEVEMVGRKVQTGAVVGIAVGVAGAIALAAALSAAKRSVESSTFLAQRAPTAPLPLAEAASLAPAGAMPSPAELEELARTVALAFPE